MHQQKRDNRQNLRNTNRLNEPKQGSGISFTWVAGHINSTGNERADELAKEAAEHGSSTPDKTPAFLQRGLPTSISAIKQEINKSTKKWTKAWWMSSPRYKKLKNIDPSLPSDKFQKITSNLNRRQASILTQLRTGHIPLNKHLYTIHKANTPHCPQDSCYNATEDIYHYLFTCPSYIHARYHLMRTTGKDNFTLASLLANEEMIPLTLTYLNKTGRFRHIYGEIASV
jgi:RNase H